MNTTSDAELSRLSFEERLIAYCEDGGVPLLTRVGLLGIAAGRLDSYFMTRVGRLKRQIAEGKGAPRHGGATPSAELAIVAREVRSITRRAYRLLDDELMPALATHGVRIEEWSALSDEDRQAVCRVCRAALRDLRPLTVARGEPLPHVRNLRPALIAAAGADGAVMILELPAGLPRLVRIEGQRFVRLEQLIPAEVERLEGAQLFRVTRSADVDFEPTIDLIGSVEQEVVRRPYQEVIRLEVDRGMPRDLRELLLSGFQHEVDTPEARLDDQDVYAVDGLMDLTALGELANLDLPHLKSPRVRRRRSHIDRQHLGLKTAPDQLFHFPFDDYDASITEFLAAAAMHEDLKSIKTTVYRTEEDSSVAAALLTARDRGAEVQAVVELKASFDEADNIELARTLAAHGVHVMLSPTSIKVHAKIALVTLGEGPTRRQVALIGTGNMNAETSRSYIDLWLVTSRPEYTRELDRVFDVLSGATKAADFDHLMVAPINLRKRFIELIRREAEHAYSGRPAGIRALVNGLTDPAIMAALLFASQAGVPIDLMVRGVCALTPGIPAISDNIRIVSVLGLLLQHARIFHFRNGGDDEYFIGSADWRPRNLDGRVEVVARVTQADHTARLDLILDETLNSPDAWTLGRDGVYLRGSVTEDEFASR